MRPLGHLVLIAEAQWSVSVATVPSIALLAYFAGTSTDPKTAQLARTYTLSAHLALLSVLGVLWGTLQVIATQ